MIRNKLNRMQRLLTNVALGLLLLSGIVVMPSCTTSSYGDKFVLDGQVAEQYRFKVYVGGLQVTAPDSQAEKRIKEFMAGKDYSSYKIVNRRYSAIPSYYEYTVKFAK
jgi:hypothetical protein